jgi:hypothetical protein
MNWTNCTHYVEGKTTNGQVVFYTGGAGNNFVSNERSGALVGWVESGAKAVAARLNRGSNIHGITFEAKAQ